MGGWETEEAWIEGDWDDLLAARLHFLGVDAAKLSKSINGASIRYLEWNTSILEDIEAAIVPLSREHPNVTFVFTYESHSRHGFMHYQTTVKNGLLTRLTETTDFEAENLPPIILERYDVSDIYATATFETLNGEEVLSREDSIQLFDKDEWLTVPKSADGEFLPQPRTEPDTPTCTF